MADWPREAHSSHGLLPRLTLTWGDDGKWTPCTNAFFIGRTPGNDGLALCHSAVSRNHVRIFLKDGQWFVEKIGRPFHLNEEETDFAELGSGDKLKIGPFILAVAIAYALPATASVCNGQLKSSHLELLGGENFCVGSDSEVCRIVVSQASPRHALFYRHRNSQDWWIADCSSDSGTRVNGTRVRNERLYYGDKVTIAGVDILFDGESLHVGRYDSQGLTVEINQISVCRDQYDILKNISLNVQAGEFVGILGPSGCGKSSLIQRIVGLGQSDSGEIKIDGRIYHEVKTAAQSVTAYLPQQVALHEELTLGEEINCFCRLHGKSARRVPEILKLVGLSGENLKRIGSLSGGQQRRTGIALELLRDPLLLVLDEPTAGLDPATETEIMTYLRRIANQGRTVICSTHILENLNLFDKVLLLSKGKTVFLGTPDELVDYFNLSTPLALYRLLGKGSAEEQLHQANCWSERYAASGIRRKHAAETLRQNHEIPAVVSVSPAKQITGYLKRSLLELFSFRHAKSFQARLLAFGGSACFIQLLFQPLLVAMVLKLSCAFKFWSADEGKELLFFAAIAVFWLGLNNAIRELVRERTPWRCLERLEQISMSRYLAAKLLWAAILCLFQVLFFSLLMNLIPNFITKETLSVTFSFAITGVLFLVCVMGAWIGLAISAMFKKETAAVGLLPIILIPVLFFSQPIIRDGSFGERPFAAIEGNDNYSPLAVHVARFMPCQPPQVLMDQLSRESGFSAKSGSDKNANIRAAWGWMLLSTGSYMALALILIIMFQSRNERQWEGR